MARTTFSGPVASGDGFISVAATSGKTLTIQAPAALTADTTLTFPDGAGSNGQVLTTNGTGTLSFTTVSGSGTVTSVAATAGTGISITGSPITGAGTLAITNTAPDQVVALTGAGSTTISGTYPNFTITSSGGGAGDVVGPASSTDNAITRYDLATGKLLQNSLTTISDTGAITAPNDTGSMIPFYFATLATLPVAANSHGAVAHAHDTGKMYYAHASAWFELANALSFSMTANGASDAYVFTGSGIVAGNTDDPVLFLKKGFTYTFNNLAAGHPFEIRVSNGGAQYTPGVTGSTTGIQFFTVPMDAPATLYYQCAAHPQMGAAINIS